MLAVHAYICYFLNRWHKNFIASVDYRTNEQCSRCQGFGHGSSNCTKKKFQCVSCGDSHDSKTCPNRKSVITSEPMDPPPKPRAPNELVKCANCGLNHTANFVNCQTRIDYQRRIVQARSQAKTKHRISYRDADDYYHQFPTLQAPRDTSYMQQHFKPQPAPVHEPVGDNSNPANISLISELLQTQQQLITNMMSSLLNQVIDKMDKMFDNMLQKINIINSTTTINNNDEQH